MPRTEIARARSITATTFAKVGSALGVPDLVRAMDDEYWQVRVKAARSLGKLKARAAVPTLCQALQHAVSNLRKEAVIALGEVGDARAITHLERALHEGVLRGVVVLAGDLEDVAGPRGGKLRDSTTDLG